MKYAILIPAKDEESIIGTTLQLLINQTLQPSCIVVIDNDSTDNTAGIIKKFASKYSFVKYMNYEGEASYALGGKIVKIFNAGKNFLDSMGVDYNYIVKLDADINLEKDVFERIASYVEKDNFGIVSPLAYTLSEGNKVFTSTPDWHTSGDFKVYRKDCYEAMGGLREDLGWDCADNVIAMESGYKTRVIRDIHYEQTRPIGRYSLLKGWKRQGLGAYKLRYNPAYLMMKTGHDLFKAPVVMGSVYYLNGYFTALLKRHPKVLTRSQGKILRKLFWKSFFDRFRTGHFYLLQRLKKKKTAD